jgi:hypothetical protein
MSQNHSGGCLCGAVRFSIAGPAKWTAWCHCRSCRRHTGAPVSAYAGFEKSQVQITDGAIAWHQSSTSARRGFCATCGSSLAYEGERWPSEIHLHIGVLDDPEAFAPTGHAFPEERVAWVCVGPPPLP